MPTSDYLHIFKSAIILDSVEKAVSFTTNVIVDCVIEVTAAPLTVTLVDAHPAGEIYCIVDRSGLASVASPITILPTAPDLIDGLASLLIDTPYGSRFVVSDGVNWHTIGAGLPQVARAKAHNAGVFSVPNNALTVVTWGSEAYDNRAFHSTVANTSRMTIAQSGIYLVHGQCEFAADGTGRRRAQIILNGATVKADDISDAVPTDPHTMNISWCGPLVAADFVELRLFQSRGSALDISGGADASYLAIHRLEN